MDIKPYKQRGNTCAIACMLMVLECYKIIPKADWLYEKKYYRAYKSKYMEGTPFSALAWHFAKNDLDTEIIHSKVNIFDNSKGLLDDDVFENAMNEYYDFLKIAEEKGAKISNGCKINCDILKQKLNENKLIILAGTVNDVLHAILVCGYVNDKFIVCDPLYKNEQLKTQEEINSYIETPLGKWCVVVGDKKIGVNIFYLTSHMM